MVSIRRPGTGHGPHLTAAVEACSARIDALIASANWSSITAAVAHTAMRPPSLSPSPPSCRSDDAAARARQARASTVLLELEERRWPPRSGVCMHGVCLRFVLSSQASGVPACWSRRVKLDDPQRQVDVDVSDTGKDGSSRASILHIVPRPFAHQRQNTNPVSWISTVLFPAPNAPRTARLGPEQPRLWFITSSSGRCSKSI